MNKPEEQQPLPLPASSADTPKLVSRTMKIGEGKNLKARGFADKALLDVVEIGADGRERIVLQLYVADAYSAAWLIEHAARELAEAVKTWHATHPAAVEA